MKRNLAFVLMLSVAGCRDNQPQPQSNAVHNGGTVVMAIPTNPDYLNGLLSGEKYAQEINRNVLYLPLLAYDEKLNLKPMLAESWQMEGDTAVTIHLRKDVRWHDGVKVDAYDVDFTFHYGTDPKTEYPNGDYWVGWNKATVIDSSTIRFSISPQPDALANLPWIPIMPRHLLGMIKPEELKKSDFNRHPIGDGPFKFVDMQQNQQIVFAANDDFPKALGGRPHLDRLVFRVIPDETAQETELIGGNVDMTPLRPDRINGVKARAGLRVIPRPGRQFGFIAWNTKRPPFNDARVRRALTMAIDREEIVKVIRQGAGDVVAGPVPSYHWSFDPRITPLPFSPDSAKKELAAAGMKNLQFELKVPSNNKQNADIAEMVRSDLADVGVTAKIRLLDFNTIIGDITSKKRDFDGVLMAWENDFRLVLHDNFHSKSINNPFQFSSYRNPKVDSLLDIVESTPERAAAVPAWRELQRVMRDEEPWTFLFTFSDAFGVRERLQNVQMDIRGILVNVQDWWTKD